MSATSDTTTTTITLDPSVNKAPYRDADAAGVHHHHHQHDLAKNLPEPESLKVRLEALVLSQFTKSCPAAFSLLTGWVIHTDICLTVETSHGNRHRERKCEHLFRWDCDDDT